MAPLLGPQDLRRDLGAIEPRLKEIVTWPAGEHESFRLRSEPWQAWMLRAGWAGGATSEV